jgi:hypothetical protein
MRSLGRGEAETRDDELRIIRWTCKTLDKERCVWTVPTESERKKHSTKSNELLGMISLRDHFHGDVLPALDVTAFLLIKN